MAASMQPLNITIPLLALRGLIQTYSIRALTLSNEEGSENEVMDNSITSIIGPPGILLKNTQGMQVISWLFNNLCLLHD